MYNFYIARKYYLWQAWARLTEWWSTMKNPTSSWSVWGASHVWLAGQHYGWFKGSIVAKMPENRKLAREKGQWEIDKQCLPTYPCDYSTCLDSVMLLFQLNSTCKFWIACSYSYFSYSVILSAHSGSPLTMLLASVQLCTYMDYSVFVTAYLPISKLMMKQMWGLHEYI